jgi:UDP-glucose 4-epimerase
LEILLTGGAGFLGGHLQVRLKSAGHRVTIVDDLSSGRSEYGDISGRFIRMDIRDRSALNALLSHQKPDLIIHLAHRSRKGDQLPCPEILAEVNVGGTAALLNAMRSTQCTHLIFASSLEVYEQTSSEPVLESDLLSPCSSRGRYNLIIESLLQECSLVWGLKPVILRFSNLGGADPGGCFGRPNRQSMSLVPSLVRAFRGMKWPDRLSCLASEASFDLLHVADAAGALLGVVGKIGLEPDLTGVFNVCSGVGVSFSALIQEMEEISGRKIQILKEQLAAPNPFGPIGDRTAFSELFDWVPESTYQEVLASAWSFERGQSQ